MMRDGAPSRTAWISNDELQLGRDAAEALGDWQARLTRASVALNSDSEDATVTTEGNNVYLNGHLVAIVKGDPITADQVTLRRKAMTAKEELIINLNARLRGQP